MQRVFGTLLLSAALLGGCGSVDSAGENKADQGPTAATEDEGLVARDLVVGRWRVVDDSLGSMELTVTEDLECALVDVRGKRWEFEGDEEDEGVEATLDLSERGLKILINQPETSLDVAGSINYSKGEVTLVFAPKERDGQEVLCLRVYREARRADTLQSINLLRVAPEVTQPGGSGE